MSLFSKVLIFRNFLAVVSNRLSKFFFHYSVWLRINTNFLSRYFVLYKDEHLFFYTSFFTNFDFFLIMFFFQCFSEIINIGYAVYKMDNLPWFRSMSWYFLVGTFFSSSNRIQTQFRFWPNFYTDAIFVHCNIIFFTPFRLQGILTPS